MAKKAPKTDVKKTQSKTIRIACEGADVIDINLLVEFQGDLKALPEQAYQRLRLSILTLGFSFPVQVWRSKGKNLIIDAHQRVATLKRMRDEEGFTIPPLPVVWIEAANESEAAKKLLAATSQFGEVTNDGLKSYMDRYDIDLPTVQTQFQFPEIDIDQFREAYFTPPEEVSFTKGGSKEIDSEEFEETSHECPKCKFKW